MPKRRSKVLLKLDEKIEAQRALVIKENVRLNDLEELRAEFSDKPLVGHATREAADAAARAEVARPRKGKRQINAISPADPGLVLPHGEDPS
jgi:hypothetical protein